MNFVIKSNSSQQFGANLGCANNSIDLVLNGSENGFVWHLVIYPLLISFCVEKQLHFFGANYIVRKSETSYFFRLLLPFVSFFNCYYYTNIQCGFFFSISVCGWLHVPIRNLWHAQSTYPLEMIRWIYTFSLKYNSTICNNKNALQFLQCFLMISRCLPACLPFGFVLRFFFSSHFHLWNKKCNRNKNKSYKFLYPMFSRMYEIFLRRKTWKSVCALMWCCILSIENS